MKERGLIKQEELEQRTQIFKCPACNWSSNKKFEECPHCGIIVAKFRPKKLIESKQPTRISSAIQSDSVKSEQTDLRDNLIDSEQTSSMSQQYKKGQHRLKNQDIAKREAIKKYFFKQFPFWAILVVLFGLLVAIGGSLSEDGVVAKILRAGTGLVILAIGVLPIYRAVEGMPSDQEMDQYIAEDLSLVKTKSLQKTSVDKSELVGESVMVTGPRFYNTAGAEILTRKGTDGRLRFTPINVSVLHMTQNQLICYQCCLDLTTANSLNEATDEYFYYMTTMNLIRS